MPAAKKPTKKAPAKAAVAKKATPKNRPAGRPKAEAAPKGLQTYETQRKALAYRAAGYTYREIGKALDITHTWARQLCLTGLAEEKAENVAELREQSAFRLDQLRRAAWPAAMNGDVRAIATCLRVEERYARLMGLDAPVQIDVDQTTHIEGAVLVIEGDTREQYLGNLQSARALRAVP